jgi:Ser/Thr protein kinase RdoA (MazF antagonist)
VLDLRPWRGLRLGAALTGGHRNAVAEVHGGPVRLVARRSRRSDAALAWELDLLDHLRRHGFTVPALVPADDGRRSADGVVVQTWLHGRAPRDDEWGAVVDELTRLHRVTTGWPQRPGSASTRDLLTRDRGGDVDLTRMPALAVAACRAAWRPLAGGPRAVVHGDPGPSNIRVDGSRVGLLDWDEARVDHVDLDLADIPSGPLPGDRGRTAAAAADAWEAAAGWIVEPRYARSRLDRLLDRR